MLHLTSFICDRLNGCWAVPSIAFEMVLQLYGSKWNIIKVIEFSREALRGEQVVYDKLLEPGFVAKCDPIINGWLIKGLDAQQLETIDKEVQRFSKACGKHWKEVQFWQGNCSAAGTILSKLINE